MDEAVRSWAGPIASPGATELGDRYALSQLVKVYALGIDMRDYELTRSVFADGAVAEGSTTSGAIDEYLPDVFAGAAAFGATQHNITNQHIDLNGDEARVWSDAIAVHKPSADGPESELTLGVQYRDTCQRFPDGWLITQRSVVVRWVEGRFPERTGA